MGTNQIPNKTSSMDKSIELEVERYVQMLSVKMESKVN